MGLTFLTKHLKRDVTEAERRVEQLMELRREEQVSATDIFSDVAVLAAAVDFICCLLFFCLLVYTAKC